MINLTATSTTRIADDTVRATFSTENAAFTSTISTVAGVSYGAVLDGDGFHNPEGAAALNDLSFDDGTTLASDLIDIADLQVTDLVVGAEIREGAVTGTEGVSSTDSVRMTAAFPAGEVAASTLASVFADAGETTTDATACLINPAQRCAP